MTSDSDSGDEIFSTDCATSGTEGLRRKRRAPVSDPVHRVGGRRPKRAAPNRGSPGAGGGASADSAAPGAVGPAAAGRPGSAATVSLNTDTLTSIQEMINAGISKVIKTFDVKFERLEKRITLLESEGK
ncbi:hypothetical protein FJT64_018093 [Amphibalanus amphitrite]|uniref:Uncharacterized protein n=1 Tax=Amphibalanus amphitrite TaxID=1232801 RepID=A0A6A4WU48_AMPAM|nr:hypothetical protein FJT64_018093 [Amphibalanus amphitrite]